MKQAIMAAALAAAVALPAAGNAQTIIEEWGSVQAPAAPALKPVKIETDKTALLVLDLVKQTCNNERRPRCVASIPKVQKLLADARAKNMLVVYTGTPTASVADTLPEVAPKGGEPTVASVADKFVNTELEKILKDKGITTVITVGTAAHGAVLQTSSQAAMRGFNVVVPVEGMSAESPFAELATAWALTNSPTVANKVTLTKIDMISY